MLSEDERKQRRRLSQERSKVRQFEAQARRAELRAAFEAGHAYVAFDSLVTATGFDFFYKTDDGQSLMGNEVALASSGVLTAVMPVNGSLILKRNGVKVAEERGSELRFTPKQPGVYRVEGYLEVEGQFVPWIYSNPIYLK